MRVRERERGVSNGVDTEAGPGRSIIATKRSFIASDKVDRQRLGTVPPRNHELTPLPLSFLAVQKGPAASWQEVESYLIYHTLLVARKFFPTLFIRSRLYLTRHVYRQLFSLSRREKLEEETRYPVYRRLRTGRDLRGELSPSLFQREREEKEEKERLPTGRPPFFLAARKPWLRFVPPRISLESGNFLARNPYFLYPRPPWKRRIVPPQRLPFENVTNHLEEGGGGAVNPILPDKSPFDTWKNNVGKTGMLEESRVCPNDPLSRKRRKRRRRSSTRRKRERRVACMHARG